MKKTWTAPHVTQLSRAEDAQQNFGLCADGQNGRGRRINNCS